jgi:beta-1,4-N-acetylglucosaminyltransferase
MHAFVTVGSTSFDSLVQSVLSSSVLFTLRNKGYTSLAVQCGDSNFELASITHSLERDGIGVELWKFKPSLQEEYERADLVISHAGML